MTLPSGLSRREIFLKIGILFNTLVGAALAVPIVRYIFSPITRGRRPGYESWLSLGSVDQFPSGQTRLATYERAGCYACHKTRGFDTSTMKKPGPILTKIDSKLTKDWVKTWIRNLLHVVPADDLALYVAVLRPRAEGPGDACANEPCEPP